MRRREVAIRWLLEMPSFGDALRLPVEHRYALSLRHLFTGSKMIAIKISDFFLVTMSDLANLFATDW
jgi:hypothetical protein